MPYFRLTASVLSLAALIWLGTLPVAGHLGVANILDPVSGMYATARSAGSYAFSDSGAGLEAPVTVAFDGRGVPHIFAESHLDATRALGFAVARDRLFQLEYVPRVAAGRLSEILGPDALETDRYLRRTGMLAGALLNLSRIQREDGIEMELLDAFADGVNSRIRELKRHELPLEFRLLGITPEAFSPLKSLLVLQYMSYDLTFEGPDVAYLNVVGRLGRAAYDSLYPSVMPFAVPIVRGDGDLSTAGGRRSHVGRSRAGSELLSKLDLPFPSVAPAPEFPGFVPGKGSNNWVLSGQSSSTGAPLLAGDMHLGLSVPSVWYEAHLVTPDMDVYGVTVPGAPTIVAGITDSLAWTFTNTGADQIDHYLLRTDSSGTKYWFDEEWTDFEIVVDTFAVRDAEDVIETRYRSLHGPVIEYSGRPFAIRWVGHYENRVLRALAGMNSASNEDEFEAAVRSWDTPMQNIAYADVRGNVRLRSTGHLPVRASGSGCGVLDGTSSDTDWVGRVPFDSLPVVDSPTTFATSTNQLPTISDDIYVDCRWSTVFRSARIDRLLSAKSRHTVDDMKAYQADVHSVQADLFVPLLDTLSLSGGARVARDTLLQWDGEMSVDSSLPVLFDLWMTGLESAVWDEPAFAEGDVPHLAVLATLLATSPQSEWFDRVDTPARESANDVLRQSFELAAADWTSTVTWGEVHQLSIRHISRLAQLRPLWRGPYPYPGYRETLSPASGRVVTHSASWRVIVDMSTSPPAAQGVFPGGQSGDPLSALYDNAIDTYLRFDYADLLRPQAAEDVEGTIVVLRPDR